MVRTIARPCPVQKVDVGIRCRGTASAAAAGSGRRRLCVDPALVEVRATQERHSGVTHHRRRRPDHSCLSAPVSQRLPRGEYDRTEYGGLPVTTAYSLMLLCGNRFPSYYLVLPAAAVVFSAPSHAAPACAVVPLRVPTRYVIAISRPWRGHRRPWQPAR
jgi:hypothetical protein